MAIKCLYLNLEIKVKMRITMTINMTIRTETTADHNAIETLTYRAFENHPHHAPGAKPTEHLIINKLRDAGVLTVSLVAEDDTGIIGHIALSPVAINGVTTNWYGLGPVAVTPERQGEGIGRQLIEASLTAIKSQHAAGVVLLGEPEYYGRFGFETHANLTLEGVPPEYFMIQSLCDDNDTTTDKATADKAIPVGEVTYHVAFS